MANVINTTTLQFLRSVNSPDYPAPTWKRNPDMSAVDGVDRKYWKWDAIAERPIPMDAGEQVAHDLQQLESSRDAVVAQLDRQEDVLRSVVAAIIGELNDASDTINAILAAAGAATSLATFKTEMALIANRPTRTMAQLRTVVRNALGQ